MLHVNIIMFLVDKNKSHVNIIAVSKPMGGGGGGVKKRKFILNFIIVKTQQPIFY